MGKLNGQEMVDVFASEENPKVSAEQMDDFTNNMSADVEGFIEAMKKASEEVKTRFSTISLLWIKKMTKLHEGEWYDLRNEYSAETSVEISNLLGESLTAFHPEYDGYVERYDKKNSSFVIKFVEEKSRTHRTLQQTFSGIVFRWLAVMGDVSEDAFIQETSRKVKEHMEESFHSVPMI